MATIERFEELEVWKAGMELCAEVYKTTNTELFAKDFGLKDQIRRASVSVPSNISEGYERDSKKQFLYFLVIAKGSCGEVRTQLKIAQMLGYINEDNYEIINNKALTTIKQLAGFIKYLKQYQPNKD